MSLLTTLSESKNVRSSFIKGTPCLSEKLAWFADPPSRRVFSASQMNGTKGGDSAGGVVGRKSALMTTTTNLITSPSICASPATAAPTSATLHKTPVFVARKTASIVSQPLNASAVTAVANDLVFTESPSNMSDPAPSVCFTRPHLNQFPFEANVST